MDVDKKVNKWITENCDRMDGLETLNDAIKFGIKIGKKIGKKTLKNKK